MPRLVYSKKYNVDIGAHVFPTAKYKLIYERLVKDCGITPEEFAPPEPAQDEDVLRVHTQEYVTKLKNGTLSQEEIVRLELPYSKALVDASWLCAGGTILACQIALKEKIGIHVGGGFHHAHPDHGEGFCVINDIAIGIQRLRHDGALKRALVVDCDLHHGNGTATIFAKDKDVFTFSIHQENNYPFYKPPSDLDIGLEDGAGDEEYLTALKKHIPKIIETHKPEFIMFVAGADPYEHDQLGGLSITMKGLKSRDELLAGYAKKNDISMCVVLAGGYAFDVMDTVKIHCNTILTCLGK